MKKRLLSLLCVLVLTVSVIPAASALEGEASRAADTLSTLGNMVVPLSMLLIGCSLVQVRLGQILLDPYSYFISALRLAVFPLIVLGALCLIPGVPNLVALTCCLAACLPSASLCVVFAQQYNCEPAYASRAVVQGMLLMIGTVPLFMSLAIAAFPV